MAADGLWTGRCHLFRLAHEGSLWQVLGDVQMMDLSALYPPVKHSKHRPVQNAHTRWSMAQIEVRRRLQPNSVAPVRPIEV